MRIILFLLLLVLGVRPAISQATPFQKKLPAIDRYIDSFMHTWNIPGLALCIVYKDQLIYAKGYGYRDLENKLPVNAQTIFPIASNTKLFTATAACMLEGEGLLSLDKPARDYLPWLRFSTDELNTKVTLRDMLAHRTGLPGNNGLWVSSTSSRNELVQQVASIRPALGFREGYIYNNMMYVASGTVMEAVSGKSWESIIRDKILAPLQMNATGFFGEEKVKGSNIAFPYYNPDTSRVLKRRIQVSQTPALGPAGTMLSNLDDMSHWMIAQLNAGKYKGVQAIPAKAIQQTMVPNAVADRVGKWPELSNALYALGRNIQTYKGYKIALHTGSIDGFYSNLTFIPSDSIGVFMVHNSSIAGSTRSIMAFPVLDRLLDLSNTDWSGRYLLEYKQEVALEAKAKDSITALQVKNTSPSHPLKNFTGKYSNPAYGLVMIEMQGDSMVFSFRGINSRLHHFHYNQFFTKEEQNNGRTEFSVEFRVNTKGEADRMVMSPFGDPETVFIKEN